MPLDAATGTIIGVICGGVFSSATTIATLLISKRSEDRRHTQEIALRVASEHYDRFCKQIERVEPGTAFPPHMFDAFLAHIHQIIEVLNKPGRVSAKSLLQSYANIQAIYDAINRNPETKGGEKQE